MNQPFHIPVPCFENWDQMTPVSEGRNCDKCCKVVVDFSDWETSEIASYLTSKKDTPICGRIMEDQLTPALSADAYVYNLVHSGLAFLKKVAAILLFAICIAQQPATAQQPITKDTLRPQVMGKIKKQPIHTPLKKEKVINRQQPITGLIAPSPYPTPVK